MTSPTRPRRDDQVNILIVDDEPKNLTVLETVLDDPGYRLVRAQSGEEALLALMAGEFAVLVLDVSMPDMTGFELAQMIKDRKKTAGMPIIFLTAYYNEDEHVLEGYGSGAVDYMVKPVNPPVLRSKVAVFAELHRRGRALKELNESLDRRIQERTLALQESESQLREANARKDEFLATLAHELRNPLAPIRNAAHVLRARGSDPERQAWACDLIDRQIHSMSRLIDDLMDVSRINQGRIELRCVPTSLAHVLREAAEATRPLLQEGGHEFRLQLPADDLEVMADPVRLIQAFMNLLNNAAKYTDRGGMVALTTAVEGAHVQVVVSDTGIGIPADQLQKVFGMFSQVETALARSRGGLGIGLSLTQRLVEMHGGTVAAHSDGLGMGSRFVVRLPLRETTGESESDKTGDEPMESPTVEALRVLIADDNVDAAATMAMLLELSGHEVRHVNDGEAAVQAVSEFKPDIAFLDIGMPRLNGYEAARAIRAQAKDGQVPFLVAVTGWGQPEDRQRSAHAGFDKHLVKPVDPAVLFDAMQAVRRSA